MRVLVLSASGERADVLAAVKAGATGYLVKSASREELIEAVRSVAAGDAVFTPGLAGLVLGEFRRMADDPGGVAEVSELTPREIEVPRLVAKCRSYKQIAEELVISHRTVQNPFRTRCANCSCTTGWNWSVTPSTRAWKTPA